MTRARGLLAVLLLALAALGSWSPAPAARVFEDARPAAVFAAVGQALGRARAADLAAHDDQRVAVGHIAGAGGTADLPLAELAVLLILIGLATVPATRPGTRRPTTARGRAPPLGGSLRLV